MDRRLLTVLVAFAITGCAGIGVRTEGVSGPVAWYVTDLELAKRMIEGQEREVYSFTLVLKETTGTEISFTRIERTVYGPDTGSSSVADTGRWELPAYCERRFPFSVYFDTSAGLTAPLWNVILTGTNDQGQKVRLAIDIALPSEPSATETVKGQPGRGPPTIPPVKGTATKDPQSSPLSDLLSPAQRQRIRVVTSPVDIPDIHDLFSTKGGRTIVDLPPVTIQFAGAISQPLHHGLRNVAGAITPHTLSLNSTITLALNLAPYGGDYAALRYTYVEHPPLGGRCPREILIERLGSIGVEGLPPSEVESNKSEFAQHNFKRGSGWSNQEFETLLAALAQIPDSMLSVVDGLRFNRARAHPTEPDQAGDYDSDTHTITMYDRAFTESLTRAGTPGHGLSTVASTSIVHEIGHAIDLRPLTDPWRRREQAEAALHSRFAQYEIPAGSGNYRVPSGEEALFNRLREGVTAAEGAIDRARSASGYRWQLNPQAGGFEVVGGGTGVARNAFRQAAQKDGGIGITEYSDKDWGEFFAESFSLYITDPQTLQRLRPHLYAFFVADLPR